MNRITDRRAAATTAFFLLAAACSRPDAPAPRTTAAPAESHGPATLEEAKALAAARHVPVLVDFWSPT